MFFWGGAQSISVFAQDASSFNKDDSQIGSLLRAFLQRKNREANVSFSHCELVVEYIFSQSCESKYKVAKSTTKLALHETRLVEGGTSNGRPFIRFWFKPIVVESLKERVAKSHDQNSVFFREEFFYCDGSKAPSKTVTEGKIFFGEIYFGAEIAQSLNDYSVKYCQQERL